MFKCFDTHHSKDYDRIVKFMQCTQLLDRTGFLESFAVENVVMKHFIYFT